MTVHQLITQLQQIDPDTRVFRQGYEGGYNDVNNILTNVDMVLDVYDSKYFGSHEQIRNMEIDGEYSESKTIVKGIII